MRERLPFQPNSVAQNHRAQVHACTWTTLNFQFFCAVAPMVPAEDATLIDTTELDAEAAFARALAVVEDKLRG